LRQQQRLHVRIGQALCFGHVDLEPIHTLGPLILGRIGGPASLPQGHDILECGRVNEVGRDVVDRRRTAHSGDPESRGERRQSSQRNDRNGGARAARRTAAPARRPMPPIEKRDDTHRTFVILS